MQHCTQPPTLASTSPTRRDPKPHLLDPIFRLQSAYHTQCPRKDSSQIFPASRVRHSLHQSSLARTIIYLSRITRRDETSTLFAHCVSPWSWDYSTSNSPEKKSIIPDNVCSLPSTLPSLCMQPSSPSFAPSASSTSSLRLPATSVMAMT